MSRKIKFSSSWKKAKAKVQKIHMRIAKARKDFHAQQTTVQIGEVEVLYKPIHP